MWIVIKFLTSVYGVYSSIGRVLDCGSSGCRIVPDYTPNKEDIQQLIKSGLILKVYGIFN